MMALLCAVFGFAYAQDELTSPWSHTFSTTEKTFTADGTETLSGADWTLAVDWVDPTLTDYNKDSSKGMKIGTSDKIPNGLTLSSSSFPGTITQVSFTFAGRSKSTINVAVTVGGSDFEASQTTFTNQQNLQEVVFTGAGSGEIVISIEHDENSVNKGAFYIGKLGVEFSASGNPVAAKPVITPEDGTVFRAESQEVTITTATAGATIHYTINGGAEQTYTAPFTITETTTITAYATADGMDDSAVATATITKKVAPESDWYESFDNMTGTGGNDGVFSGITGASAADPDNCDNAGWTFSTVFSADQCVYLGTGSATNIKATTPALGLEGDGALYFKAVAWGGDTNIFYVDIEGDGEFEDGTQTKQFRIEKSKEVNSFGDLEVNFTGITANTKFVFRTPEKKRAFLDEVYFVMGGETPPVVEVPVPTFSPAAGEVEAGSTVTISAASDDDEVYYTIDGTSPIENNSALGGDATVTVTINEAVTIKAAARNEEGNWSEVVEAAYTVKTVIPEVTIPNIATFRSEKPSDVVTLQLNGVEVLAVNNQNIYVRDANSGTASAISFYQSKQNWKTGDILTGSLRAKYDVYQMLPEAITFSDINVEVVEATNAPQAKVVDVADVTIDNYVADYIQIMGAVTGSGDNRYIGEVQLFVQKNIAASITSLGGNVNATKPIKDLVVVGKTYTVKGILVPYNSKPELLVVNIEEEQTEVNTPTITPEGGIFTEPVQVTISSDQSEASIYYTLDGTDPTNESTAYTGPFMLNETTTVKAIAYIGDVASTVTTATFTFPLVVNSIAEFRQLEVGETAILNLEGAQVTVAAGNNVYVRDAGSDASQTANAICFYKCNLGTDVTTGAVISGQLTGTRADFNGLPELTNATDVNITVNGVQGNLSWVKNVENLEDVTTDNYVADLIMFEGTVTKNGKNFFIGDIQLWVDDYVASANDFYGGNVTASSKVENLVEEGKNYLVAGILISYYNNPELYLMHVEEKAPKVEVEYTFNSYGIGTLYYSDVRFGELPEGVQAFYVNGIDGKELTEHNLTTTNNGYFVPAGCAVILRGEPNSTVTLEGREEIVKGEDFADNLLRGTDEDVSCELADAEYLYYHLSAKDGEIGFYWGAEEGAPFTNGAHKAFLALTPVQAAQAPAFYFSGTSTGISTVAVDSMLDLNAPMYNLAGQRVDKSYKGVVIQNGKKVIKK